MGVVVGVVKEEEVVTVQILIKSALKCQEFKISANFNFPPAFQSTAIGFRRRKVSSCLRKKESTNYINHLNMLDIFVLFRGNL